MHHDESITYLILAGGRGQRMQGEDKGLMPWQGKPMIEHIIQQLNIPTHQLIISANRNIELYKNYAAKVVIDTLDDYQGPLAGILSAMQNCSSQHILCLPCDSPSPPSDIATELQQCLKSTNKSSVLCHDGKRLQPLFSLLDINHEKLLLGFLQQGRRKVHDFMALLDPAICDFSTQADAFNNFNHPHDMQ